MSSQYTRSQLKQQNRGANVGGAVGVVGGGYGGFKGVKALSRVSQGAQASSTAFRGSRDLSNFTSGGSKASNLAHDVGTAAKTGLNTAARAPKRAGGLGALAGGYVGSLAGAAGGGVLGQRMVQRKQKPIQKNSTISAFGIDHG